jgi:hypothetical protein
MNGPERHFLSILVLACSWALATLHSFGTEPKKEDIGRLINFIWKTNAPGIEVEGWHRITDLRSDTNKIWSDVNLLAANIAKNSNGRFRQEDVANLNYEMRLKSIQKNINYRYRELGGYTKLEMTWLENPLKSTNVQSQYKFDEEHLLGPDGFASIIHYQSQARRNTDVNMSDLAEAKLLRLSSDDRVLLQLAFGHLSDPSGNRELLPDWGKIQDIFEGNRPEIRVSFEATNMIGINCHHYSISVTVSNAPISSFAFSLNATNYNQIVKFVAPLQLEWYEVGSFHDSGLPKEWRGYVKDWGDKSEFELKGEFLKVVENKLLTALDFKVLVPNHYSILELRENRVTETVNGRTVELGATSSKLSLSTKADPTKYRYLAAIALANAVLIPFFLRRYWIRKTRK